jgi:glycosyltransferase involved in cell wall biosynthesis
VNVAIVDGGSFVLPYDYQLVKALSEQGAGVTFFGSRTRYNGEFLEAMRALPGVTVRDRAVSGTAAPRWKGVLAYSAMWLEIWRQRRHFDAINLQFSAWWPLERLALPACRDRLIYTVHNAVPHGFAGRRHGPTERIAELARTLLFVSRFTQEDFIARYGERFRAKSRLVPHGLLPIAPGLLPMPYAAAGAPEALVYWSTVKPYKGVEIFAALARSQRIRATGLGLEIHGAWAAELHGLRDELRTLGVRVDDRYLGAAELLALLGRNVVFILPYREASQSGALYSLLQQGRIFMCTDVGDPGDFMRRFGLEAMLLKERSADAVAECLERLRRDETAIVGAFQAAQDACGWATMAAGIAAIYAEPIRKAMPQSPAPSP